MRFVKESRIAAPAATVWAFHEAPDALMKLTPPWQKTEVLQPPSSLKVGTRVLLRARLGPLWQTIEAEHVEYEEGRMFADRMVRGPFRHWLHRHIVEPIDERTSKLIDDVEYELPLGALGRVFGSAIARRELERLFNYRHDVTKRACETELRSPK